MAKTVKWHLDELTGVTLTLRLQALGSGVTANTGGDGMTESGDGLFSATVAEDLTGWHKAYAEEAGEPVASGFVDMSEASPVVIENPTSTTVNNTTVVKLVSRVHGDLIDPLDLSAFWKAKKIHEVTIEDEDGNPVSLAGKTLQFVLFRGETETELAHVDTVTIGGTGNNELTWSVPSTAHTLVGNHSWAIREPGNDQYVWAEGKYSIKRAAGPHV